VFVIIITKYIMIMSLSKAAKAIIFTAQSQEHHTSVKLRNVLRWLKGGYEVRVQITGKPDRQKAMEDIYSLLERDIKSGARFIQRVAKPGSIKVILKPTEDAANLDIEGSGKVTVDVEKEISDISADKDVFSENFEKDLIESIREERKKTRKK
jgi:hypothetical protein